MVNKHLWKMSTIQNREDNDTKKPTKHLLFISFFVSDEVSEDISGSFNKEISNKSHLFPFCAWQ